MPTTYNGIGTHYYGKRNVETRQGPCQECGRTVELTSYDTRLWFVIVFIPFIPLGRKRIIDQCPACHRHFVLELRNWETAKQEGISAALEKFRASGTPESAIEAHQALIGFHQSVQAAEFRQLMHAKFPDDANVQAYLGVICEHLGRLDEALPYFKRAFELRPDLPDARVGVAEGHIRADRLDEARPLLDFLEKPGAAAHHSLAPLETLALGFQKAGRHTEALDLFKKLLTALPQLADHSAFRKMVERSEKALGRPASVLPKRKFSWRRLWGTDPTAAPAGGPRFTWKGAMLVGVVLLLALVGLLAWNEYIRGHRTIYVVNALTQRAELDVRGVGGVRAGLGVSQITVPEGRHHLTVRGPVAEEFDLEVSSGYFERWFNDPVWVVNVGRAAIIVMTTAHYSENPRPSHFDFFFGESHHYFPDVSHAFLSLPESMRMKSHEERTVTQLDVYPDPPAGLFQYLTQTGRMGDAWRLAEWHLRRHADDQNMLRLYVEAAGSNHRVEAAESFLRVGLTNRPVEIEWHRAYQSLLRQRTREARMATEYDAMLQAEPDSSALLYLRGRVARNRQEAMRYFERAISVDGSNGFPHYAITYQRISVGDWEGARPFAERAVSLRPKDIAFLSYLGLVRLALREHDGLEKDYRDRLKQNPGDFGATIGLCNVLTAAGKTNDVPEVMQAFERFIARQQEGSYEFTSYLRRHVLYLREDFAALEKFGIADRSVLGKLTLYQALLEQGRVKEALRVRAAGTVNEDDPFQALTISLAWTISGQPAEARDWRERAATALGAGDYDFERVATLLRSSTAPSREQLDEVVLPADSKAILLAVLAHQFPEQRGELCAASRRLNVERSFPFHLVQRATESGVR